ncbi:MAG: kinesin KIF3B [Trebouxia sp. A1-2]|nr:MAG: kinesin KIF3B [Trebouxia sp. A1-2]
MDGSPASAECVRVVVRCRPLSSTETSEGRRRIVNVDAELQQVIVQPAGDTGELPKTFTFDNVFDWNSTQSDVYTETAKPIVDSVLEGYNGTVFAYGQTGTGKTHTMDGGAGDSERGIIPKTFNQIFEAIQASQVSEQQQFLVRASFLEIYNEEVRDLLSKNPKNKLELKERKEQGVYVKGLNSFVVKSVAEITSVLEVGKKNRSVGATMMNQDSSRSHSIFTITVEKLQQGDGKGSGHVRVGKLNLVDLAGSERQSKTGATGDRLKEATKINLSLSALGNVISALVDSKSGHTPYRDSKLTRLLQARDSLGGNTKTVMIANIGPADYNLDETISTLRYANRAKNIKNKPRINEDPKDAMLREFQDEILRLKAELAATASQAQPLAQHHEQRVERIVERPLSAEEVLAMRAQMEQEMQQEAVQQGEPLDAETLAKIHEEAQRKAEAEAAAVLEERHRASEEAARMAAAAKQRAQSMHQIQAQQESEAKKKADLEAQLAAMESKVLQGEAQGGLSELARRQEEEEAEQVTRKLRKLWTKYCEAKGELDGAWGDWAAEKEEMLDSVRMLQQQLTLKDLVIQAFIPPQDVQKVMDRAQWDEEQEVWMLQQLPKKVTKRPISTAHHRRPVTAYAQAAVALGDHNPRYKTDNILALALDMPDRTTADYSGSQMQTQATLDAAFGKGHQGTMFFDNHKEQQVFLADDMTLKAHRAHRPSTARPPTAPRRPASARGRPIL